ncbi:MAG: hypothetical protein AB7S26_30250 [Sandaracinaceae bacterium]
MTATSAHALRDELSVSTPKVLRRKSGDWLLELSHLVRVEGRLYRPRPIVVRGIDEILRVLTDHDPELGDRVQRLVESSPEGDLSYDVDGEHLTPHAPADDAVVQAEAEERALRAERHAHRLEQRVDHLEHQLERLLRAVKDRASHEPIEGHREPERAAASRSGPSRPASPESSHDASAQSRDADMPVRPIEDPPASGPDEPLPEPVRIDDAPAPAREDAGPDEPTRSAEPKLAFPTVDAWNEGLGTLLGESVELEASTSRPVPDATWFGVFLEDDRGEVQGAVLTDAAATVRQGGRLLMMSEEVMSQMLSAGELSEDVTSAMSEVLNVQSRHFNDVDGNPHIKITPLAPVDLEVAAWILAPAARVDFTHADLGRTVLLSR